uniref:Uncharacterized protein n=1 Tax=Arundo donax TaxID=35708 RepID=A0A0A9AHZ0_ARUDO
MLCSFPNYVFQQKIDALSFVLFLANTPHNPTRLEVNIAAHMIQIKKNVTTMRAISVVPFPATIYNKQKELRNTVLDDYQLY